MSTIYDWSTTPGSNATADTSINWSEGMFPSVVNDSARQMMGRLAEYVKDNGILTATGTNTIAVTSNAAITAIVTGMTLSFRAAATNTTAVTLNLNGLGGKDIRKTQAGGTDSVPLVAGDINIKGIYVVVYDETTNGGAGAWILLNPLSAAYLPLAGGTMTGVLRTPQVQIISGANTGGSVLISGTTGLSYVSNGGNHVFSGAGLPTMTWGATGLLLGTPLAVAQGGTGGTTQATARAGIGLGTMATQNASAVAISGGNIDIATLSTSGTFTAGGAIDLTVGVIGRAGGTISLRPNGVGSTVGQFNVLASGDVTASGGLSAATLSATGIVSAGSAFLNTNGNPVGSVWSAWGATDAFTATGLRIESRAGAYAAIGRGVGVGQTWQPFSLGNNTWTTNATGQPIMVAVLGGSGCDIFIGVNNDTGAPARVASSPSGTAVAAVIPAGAVFKYIASGSGFAGWILQ